MDKGPSSGAACPGLLGNSPVVTEAESPQIEQGQPHKDSKRWMLATLVRLPLSFGTPPAGGGDQASPAARPADLDQATRRYTGRCLLAEESQN